MYTYNVYAIFVNEILNFTYLYKQLKIYRNVGRYVVGSTVVQEESREVGWHGGVIDRGAHIVMSFSRQRIPFKDSRIRADNRKVKYLSN